MSESGRALFVIACISLAMGAALAGAAHASTKHPPAARTLRCGVEIRCVRISAAEAAEQGLLK